jgi:hypothetical protein
VTAAAWSTGAVPAAVRFSKPECRPFGAVRSATGTDPRAPSPKPDRTSPASVGRRGLRPGPAPPAAPGRRSPYDRH